MAASLLVTTNLLRNCSLFSFRVFLHVFCLSISILWVRLEMCIIIIITHPMIVHKWYAIWIVCNCCCCFPFERIHQWMLIYAWTRQCYVFSSSGNKTLDRNVRNVCNGKNRRRELDYSMERKNAREHRNKYKYLLVIVIYVGRGGRQCERKAFSCSQLQIPIHFSVFHKRIGSFCAGVAARYSEDS